MQKCTLCGSNYLQEIVAENDLRNYFFCENCFLIFAHPNHHLSAESEKQRYSLHNNGIDQPGYVNFLNKAIAPTLPFLQSGMTGLDYGCGPVPTLSKLLRNQGFECFDYDPVFEFDHPLLCYDFIFATECLEHFFSPAKDLKEIMSLLKPGAFLTVMTERWKSLDSFKKWYYKMDPSHVSFYHDKTFEYLTRTLRLDMVYRDENRVMIFKKFNRERC